MNVKFDPLKVKPFKPFPKGAIVFGGHFGDEGKGKLVDILARLYKLAGYRILSIRGQGSGNAGHTVIVNGKKYDFHYLTSAGLSADIMLLSDGMLIDPIKVLEEAKKLPEEKRNIIMISERATICCDIDRAMDSYIEEMRAGSGQPIIGTTKSGVGPCEAFRRFRLHLTFADALKFKDYKELMDALVNRPLIPKEVKSVITEEYAKKMFDAIKSLNIVQSEVIINNCRKAQNWAVLLEVSQAFGLDTLKGNSGHFVTSTPTTPLGAADGAGLTEYDFSDGSYMVIKAYASKVGGGPFVTRLTPEESEIADFIYNLVGECGVTTGRKRDLGWIDVNAIRAAVNATGCRNICMNCMDVLGMIPGKKAKICYAYKHKENGEITYNYPYHLDEYEPVYEEFDVDWDISNIKNVEDLPDSVIKYIRRIEFMINGIRSDENEKYCRIAYIGNGGSNEDIIEIPKGFKEWL